MIPIAMAAPRHISPRAIGPALRSGWRLYRSSTGVSTFYGGLFAVVGVLIIWAVVELGAAPMVLPLIGGFLLLGPILLAGFFGISRAVGAGRKADIGDVVRGFAGAAPGLWVISLLCTFLFLIWLTDAGTLYSFMIGERSAGWQDLLPNSDKLIHFQLGASVMGAGIALIVYASTAYAVPLLIERRTGLVNAVGASVHAVFRSFMTNFLWSGTVAVVIVVAIVFPVLLAVALPVLAYASEYLYRAMFPASD